VKALKAASSIDGSIMKHLPILLIFGMPLLCRSQQIPDRAKAVDMQAVQQRMKMEQVKLDSPKKANPRLAGSNMSMPDLNKMVAHANASGEGYRGF
jgi:hypothetical protein